MSRKLSLLLSLILTLAFTSTGMAQGGSPETIRDLDGIESGYGRMLMVNSAIEMDQRLSSNELPVAGMVGVFTFEDADAAEDSLDIVGEEFATEFFDDGPVSEVEVDDLGEKAYGYISEATIDERFTVEASSVIVHADEYIYFAVVIGGEDTLAMGETWIEFMIDGEVLDDEVIFNADGTSTGGAFEIMPGETDADVTEGLLPYSDIDFDQVDAAG